MRATSVARRTATAAEARCCAWTPTARSPPATPSGRSRVWARGFRNPWGMDFDPQGGRLWLTDNGPECNDELNRVVRARNYGWGPSWTCGGRSPRNTNRDGPRPVQPERWYSPPIAPTGLAFCDGCGLGARSDGALFFGAYNSRQIRRVIAETEPARRARPARGVPFERSRAVDGNRLPRTDLLHDRQRRSSGWSVNHRRPGLAPGRLHACFDHSSCRVAHLTRPIAGSP